MATSNKQDQALTVVDVKNYAVASFETSDLLEVIRENLGGRRLGPNDLDRVTMPAQGMTLWTVPTLGGEQHVETISGVLVFKRTQRAYWPQALGSERVPPDCYSDDGEVGSKYGACAPCQFNEFGSAKDGTARGKACKESLLLFMLRPDHILPMVVALPPTSIAPLVQTMIRLASTGRVYYSAMWHLSLEKTVNADKTAYSVVVPRVDDEPIDPALLGKIRAYREAMMPMLSQVRVEVQRVLAPQASAAAMSEAAQPAAVAGVVGMQSDADSLAETEEV